MRKGDRVLFVAPWSSYRYLRAEVTEPPPKLMVLVDGERLPVAVRRDEVVLERESVTSLTGAE